MRLSGMRVIGPAMFAALAVMWMSGKALGQPFPIVQITNNNGADDDTPAVSGANIVWRNHSSNDALGGVINLFDGVTTSTISTGSRNFDPDISGSQVVWQRVTGTTGPPNNFDITEIFRYTGGTPIQVSNMGSLNSGIFNSVPAISGNNIVWQGGDLGVDNEIYHYSVSGNSYAALTTNAVNDLVPDISGTNVVWYADNEIFQRDLTGATTQLTSNAWIDRKPKISGTKIVWEGRDPTGTDLEIFMYDLASPGIVQLTSNTTNDMDPDISGGNVVWWNFSLSQSIFLHNLGDSSTLNLTLGSNTSDNRLPAIDGYSVVWQGRGGANIGAGSLNDFEIFMVSIPEPATAGMLLVGFSILALTRRPVARVSNPC